MLNKLIIKMMPIVPKGIIRSVAKKYIAGDTLSDAIRISKDLEKTGAWTTIDVLGEFVETRERALHETEMVKNVIDAISESRIPSYPSIKPTSLGLAVDFDFAYSNIKSVVEKAHSKNLRLTIDMENSPYTDNTLKLYRKLRSDGFENLGIVLQAYMFRSQDDVNAVADLKPFIRLCKGIYRESPQIAYQGKEEVRNNYKKLLRQIFDKGLYVCIATHDEPLINDAREFLSSKNISKAEYEFQMLLGVREQRRLELLKEGHHLRVYVPFGEDWYGYSSRRLKENPQVAGHIFKAIFIKK